MTRRVVIAVGLAFVAGFAFLTLVDALDNGVTILTVVSVVVVALLAVGIVGALSQPPEE